MELIRKVFCIIGILSMFLCIHSCDVPSSKSKQDEAINDVTKGIIASLTEEETSKENDIAGDSTRKMLEFRMSADITTLSTDSTSIQITLTGHELGETIHWVDQWCLYHLEGNEKSKIGSIYEEAGIEMDAANADSYATITCSFFFSDLTSGRYMTLPAGEYELFYMITYDEPSSESIRFTIVE